jgi:hypothetical protein
MIARGRGRGRQQGDCCCMISSLLLLGEEIAWIALIAFIDCIEFIALTDSAFVSLFVSFDC